MLNKITPFLWFETQAEEAALFYTSIFKDSKMGNISRYPEEAVEVSGKAAGSVMTASFELEGLEFTALNGGPLFKFSEAISFQVSCKDQAEIDYFWEKLTEGGEESQCGWLKDKFGLSWQIVPEGMGEIMGGGDPAKSGRAMKAMLEMKKLDIDTLKNA